MPAMSAFSRRDVALNIAKNSLAPLVQRLRPERRVLGMDGETSAIAETLEWFAGPLQAVDVDLDGAQVLELGPGRTSEICGAFVLAGAASAVGIDVLPYLDPMSNSAERLGPLVDLVGSGQVDGWNKATGTDLESARARAQRYGARWPVRFETFDGQGIPLPDSSVDLVVSKSVLEHVPPQQVGPLLDELKRVLKPGAAMVHVIDLRDHLFVDGDDAVTGDWLTALRYPQRLFTRMFDNRATHINRLRASAWLEALAAAGFTVVHEERRTFPLPADFDAARLQAPWSTLPREELEVGFLTVAARA